MSNTYKPDIAIYYGSIDSDHRLIPAPNISITVEHSYSNDTIISYTYIINLTGVATDLDLRNLNYGDTIPSNSKQGIGAVIDHIHLLRKILSQNGNILYIVDAQNNTTIFKAYGGILRSFNFNESNNNWVHGANYSASLEFHSVDLMNNLEGCNSTFLNPTSFPSGTAGIVDINKFKIKSFQDSWNFSFDESSAYNRMKILENSNTLDMNNITYNIEYNINATGKNFYVYEDNNSPKLLPAWEQAKNFVQYRLYYQVTNLINGILKTDYTSGCSSDDNLSNIHVPGNSNNGLLSGIGETTYKIFNEEITCDLSESEGTFSAVYRATVRSTLGDSTWSAPSATHTINKSIKTNNTSNVTNTNISINGTIQGLIEGGIIRANEPLMLPDRGTILIANNGTNSKYDNALQALNKIYDPLAYNGGIGEAGKRDLIKSFKDIIGITVEELGGANSEDTSIDPRPDAPHPIAFNLTHDYNNGSITYTAEYSNTSNCGRKYKEISIQTNQPHKIFATFNIPNSFACPTIQELGTYTAKTVSITIQGTDLNNPYSSGIDLSTIIQCGNCDDEGYWPISLPPQGNYILTQKQYTSNPIDGSYTINLGYICNTSGCSLD